MPTSQINHSRIVALIWGIADDVLRDLYVREIATTSPDAVVSVLNLANAPPETSNSLERHDAA